MTSSLFTRNHWFAYLLCAGLAIVIVVDGAHLIGGQTQRPKNEARLLLKTEAWSNLFGTEAWNTFGRELSMRRENDGSTGGLLLKHSGSEIIYRYDPAAQALHTVDFAKWQSATSPIANCVEQLSPNPRRLEINSDAEGKLVDGSGRTIATAGTFATSLRVSPDGKWVAVLSADGPKSESLIPFLGGPTPLGQRYHQVISLDDLKWVGPAVALPVANKSDLLTPCWTADEKYVVYTDIFPYYVLVVPVT